MSRFPLVLFHSLDGCEAWFDRFKYQAEAFLVRRVSVFHGVELCGMQIIFTNEQDHLADPT